MIFSCERARINEAVAVVSRAAAAKSSLAALEGILIETTRDSVRFTAYDLDIAVIFSIPAQIEAEGNIVLPAKLFGDIIRKLPEGPVRISTDEKFMTKITGSSVKFTILGLSPVEYRNNLRLQSAKLKLESGEYNVSETAEACGFSNLSFFIRLYKKTYGCTPKKQ